MNTYMETPRLILRDWKEEDIPVFAGLNNNDQVMEFFLKKLSYQETLDFYNRIRKEFASRGYGLYAVEKKENHAFIGYVGLYNPQNEMFATFQTKRYFIQNETSSKK